MPAKPERWKSLRVRPRTHQKFKKLAALHGSSIEDVAGDLVDAALRNVPSPSNPLAPPISSASVSHANLAQELDSLIKECSAPDWDGYGAYPVSPSTHTIASRFLKVLPPQFPRPSLGAESDGSISLEWYRSPHQTLSVSIGPDGNLHYAAFLGPRKQYGTEPFSATLPSVIKQLITQIDSTLQAGAA
jgi:hypothetical protein